ncbi:MAG: BatA domain-containing protein, partial [Hyphomicrobiaceae bacterium]
MTLGPIAFLSPWLLAGALALPVIWWLLRTVPPQPRRLAFPPTRILVGLENREKTPA